jgi:glutathione S-transferase
MPTYKLTYFNGRGRAEAARFVFAQAGVEYEDVRLTGEEFKEMKHTFPTGALPVLEVDGKALAASEVITRYLGEKFGLAGSCDFENAQLASIVDVVCDLMACVMSVFFGDSDESKAAAKKKLFETAIPKHFGVLEKRIKDNESPDGWIYGEKLTYVDLRIADALSVLLGVDKDKDVLASYPGLKKLNEAVNSQPRIAEWIKKRPDTPF